MNQLKEHKLSKARWREESEHEKDRGTGDKEGKAEEMETLQWIEEEIQSKRIK